jgi:hypothetical protein
MFQYAHFTVVSMCQNAREMRQLIAFPKKRAGFNKCSNQHLTELVAVRSVLRSQTQEQYHHELQRQSLPYGFSNWSVWSTKMAVFLFLHPSDLWQYVTRERNAVDQADQA